MDDNTVNIIAFDHSPLLQRAVVVDICENTAGIVILKCAVTYSRHADRYRDALQLSVVTECVSAERCYAIGYIICHGILAQGVEYKCGFILGEQYAVD